MFLLQPYYDHDRGVLDHVLTRVSPGWPPSGRAPETPDLRTGMAAGWPLWSQAMFDSSLPSVGADRRSARSSTQPSVGSALQRQMHASPKTRRARDLEDLAPGWGRRGREDPPAPFLRGNVLTSGSATSRSRSGGPGCPAAARSPAGGPGRRRSCRPSGRTPGWPCRWQRSSASCAPG